MLLAGKIAQVGLELTGSPTLKAVSRSFVKNTAAFAKGFDSGFSAPVGVFQYSIGGQGFTGAWRVARGMRRGFAEVGRVRQLRRIRPAETSEEMGIQLGRKFLQEESGLNLRESYWVNPFESASGRSRGFDDVLIDDANDFWIVDYKGGTGKLREGQMGEIWVRDVIDRMLRKAPENPWGQKLLGAFREGNLRGISLEVPTPFAPVSVSKVRAYNVGM